VNRTLIVATRKSQLALAQARAFLRDLERVTGARTEELLVTTTGDRVQDVALSQVGGKGLFIKEIEEALIERRADIAVHSMKDVPSELAPALVIGCVPVREDPRDAIVSRDGRTFEALPPGSRVGTSSLRRLSMLRAWRADLDYVSIRGNVDTRLRKCAEGVVDAVVLAYAGLRRLGLGDRATEVLEPSRCLPAVGQGALAIERRADDADVGAVLERLDHADTSIAVAAERGVMSAVEGSCQVPVAAYGIREGAELWLRGMLAEADGSRVRFREVRAPWPSIRDEAFTRGVELGRLLRRS
jgi:hydroxymethylbilane synthase